MSVHLPLRSLPNDIAAHRRLQAPILDRSLGFGEAGPWRRQTCKMRGRYPWRCSPDGGQIFFQECRNGRNEAGDGKKELGTPTPNQCQREGQEIFGNKSKEIPRYQFKFLVNSPPDNGATIRHQEYKIRDSMFDSPVQTYL